jgi:hypothetical protein
MLDRIEIMPGASISELPVSPPAAWLMFWDTFAIELRLLPYLPKGK